MRSLFTLLFSLLLLSLPDVAEAQRRSTRSGKPSPPARTQPSPAKKPDTSSIAAATKAEPRTGSRETRMSDAQQQNVQNLATDLSSIKEGSSVTQEQKDALSTSLMALADGATQPDPALVETLASDLSDALADGDLSNKEMIQLANDLETVMNSANLEADEVAQAVSDAQSILDASGIDASDVETIVRDLEAIAEEAQSNASGAKPDTSNVRRVKGSN